MIIKQDKTTARRQRAKRTSHIHGTAARPRLCVTRSTCQIYVHLINDDKGETIVAANTLQKQFKTALAGKTKKEQAYIIGQQIGKLALAKKVKEVVFDRSGYLYTGRVQQVADGARAAGLKF